MEFTIARAEDLDRILRVYESARAFMRAHGNPDQWGTAYPERTLLERDIAERQLYGGSDDGRICCAFMMATMDDPTYGCIEDGFWLDDAPYTVIHRIASDGTHHGVLAACLDYARGRSRNIRIDTHADNVVMQHLLDKQGFTRCGIIHVEDGSPRIAYQWRAEDGAL